MRHFALRHRYRFPVFGPVHYEHANREGYGTVMNVSSVGMKAFHLACFLTLSMLTTSCTNESYGEKEAGLRGAKEENKVHKQAQINERLKAFSSKYNANYTWVYGLRENTISTLELQESLIRADHRPISAMASILDIENSNGALHILFYVPHVGEDLLQRQYLVLNLQCSLSGEKAHRLTVAPSPSMEPNYLVAARIVAVRQAHQFGMAGNGSTLTPFTMEFIGEGTCVGLEEIEPTAKSYTITEDRHPRSPNRNPNEPNREY